MNSLIQKVPNYQINEGMKIIADVFLKYDAPDYTAQGVETFQTKFLQNEEFYNSIKDGEQTMYGAYVDNALAGVVVIGKSHISYCFVSSEYHRQGIGTQLMRQVFSDWKAQEHSSISLNASPYAVPFYLALGFLPTGEQSDYQGIIYTPMTIKL